MTHRPHRLFRRSSALASALALTAALGVTALSGEAEAQQLRFSQTVAGGLASTGNTLGLAKALGDNGPGTQDSIGTFISLDPVSVDNSPLALGTPWGTGTTSDWTSNGSRASLDIPMGATVLYAELIWAGSHNDNVENVGPNLDDPVKLGYGNDQITVMPDDMTSQTIAETASGGFPANYYIRSAEVTAFVESHGGGHYDVQGVPATQATVINSLNAAGWTLIVAYQGEDQPIRNLSIFVGGSFVDEDSSQDYTIDGFCAPPSGTVDGNVIVSALEGDADLTGDELLIAPTSGDTFVNLVGPNNPVDNFFASQINGADGMIDVSGSFGNDNHDAINGVNVAGGRQGWDLTTLAISSTDGQLVNDQTSAVLRTNTTGDSYVPAVVAMELDVNSPNFTGGATQADKVEVTTGEKVTITVQVTNSGAATADNLSFTMPAEPGLTLAEFTLDGQDGDVNGATVTTGDLTSGVDVGALEVGNSMTITITFDVTSGPANAGSFMFNPGFDHAFLMCANGNPIEGSYTPPSVAVSYAAPTGSGGAPPNPVTSASSSSSSSSVTTGAGGGDIVENQSIEEDGSCGCSTPGKESTSGWAAMLGLGLLGGALGRRRRRR